MKKLSLIFVCLLINLSFVFSQYIQVYRNGVLLANNEVLNISGTSLDLIEMPLNIKNVSFSTINVKAKKIQNSLLQGSENSFCFAGQCYPPVTITSSNAAIMSFNAIDTTFKADYNANGSAGTSMITYVFFNTANISDSVSVIVNYTTTVGINDITTSDVYFSEAYPNPASGTISFNYSLPEKTNAKIYITNILGAKVADVELNANSGKQIISTNELNAGIYFYSLIVNDKVFCTRKLVIKH